MNKEKLMKARNVGIGRREILMVGNGKDRQFIRFRTFFNEHDGN